MPSFTPASPSRRFLSGWLPVGLWVVVAAINTLQMWAGGMADFGTAAQYSLLEWGPWVVLTPLVWWLAMTFRVDARLWKWSLPIHLAAALLCAFLLELVWSGAMRGRWIEPPRPREFWGRERRDGEKVPARFATPGPGPRGPPDGGPPRPVGTVQLVRLRLAIPIYGLLVAAAHAVAYHQRSLERERRALLAEAKLAEARLLALQRQLQPHFLFNTLNSISALVYKDAMAADEMICALSCLLRRVLDVAERREISLHEEMDFIANYLTIQRVRFAERVRPVLDLPEELAEAAVPPLILQPLVENAIIHGLEPEAKGGEVAVRAERFGERLVLTVSDSGIGLPAGGGAKPRGRVGLRNTRERLAALYATDFDFRLENRPEGGVLARLEIPFRTVADGAGSPV